MRHALISILISAAVVLAGCRTLPEANLSPAGPHLKVITYNVHIHGDIGAVVAFLNKARAEIVFLQETHKEWDAYLSEHLGKLYPHAFYHHHPGEGGMAVLSMYPLHEPQFFYTSEGWFPAIYTRTSTPIGDIGLLNVHLKPPLSHQSRVTLGALFKTEGVHLDEINAHLGRVNADVPLIIAGDFNEVSSGKACKRLEEMGYVSALDIYDRKSHTWSYPVAFGIKIKRRYDHIFLDPAFECTGAAVFKVRASDHEPVMAAIRMKNE